MATTFIVDPDKLRDYCTELLMKENMSREDAFVTADNLVDADLSGIESHGVSRITNYLKRLRTGVVAHCGGPIIKEERAASIAIDGNNQMGMVSGKFAMDKCIEKAKQNGSCFATVNHSNHFGTASYYARMAAANGCIGIVGTNAPPNIAPWGSSQKFMGTNPIAISTPTLSDPITLDMAPSVVAMGKIILAAKLGKSIPEGWVLDPDGNPTTDPVVGQYGTLIPIGGPKGSGIAIFMEILCGILAGAQYGPHINHFWKDFEHPQDVGHFFCAIDISAFSDYQTYLNRLDGFVKEIKGLPLSKDAKQIFMPGELEVMKRKARQENGIEMSENVYKELEVLAEQYGLNMDITR